MVLVQQVERKLQCNFIIELDNHEVHAQLHSMHNFKERIRNS